ncbi:MAG: GNAT family N-acetyltransferase [Dehalococcoidia bacterium]|nr:GNAT family N-acetyltransferase [Dehalococcoidia bacterium]
MGEAVIECDNVAVRPLRDEPADYALMARWLRDPRVLRWYEGRDRAFAYGDVVAKFAPRVLSAEGVRPCIIEVDGAPAGYLQYYPVEDPSDYGLEDATGAWAFDLFLGEPRLWGSGAGTAALCAMVTHVFQVEGAAFAVIDPRVANPRAVRSYEKAGFRRVRVLPGHEWHEGAHRDCWLMVLERPQAGT